MVYQIYQSLSQVAGPWEGDAVGTTPWHYKDRARIEPYSPRIEFQTVAICYEGTSKSSGVFIVSDTLQQHNRIMIF